MTNIFSQFPIHQKTLTWKQSFTRISEPADHRDSNQLYRLCFEPGKKKGKICNLFSTQITTLVKIFTFVYFSD